MEEDGVIITARRIICSLTIILPGLGVAQPYVEDFSAGGGSAEGSLTLGAGTWSYTGGIARVHMAATAPFAIPDTAMLRPTLPSFTGNVTAAGGKVLSFRFRAGSPKPSHLYVEIAGGTSIFQRSFTVSDSGEWQTMMVSLESMAAGGWQAKRGTGNDFAATLEDVTSIAFKVRRAGATAVEHAIDDITIDGLPGAGSAMVSHDGMLLSWDKLQIGAEYVVQKSEAMSGPWVDAMFLTVTGLHQQVPFAPDDSDQTFYRLRSRE